MTWIFGVMLVVLSLLSLSWLNSKGREERLGVFGKGLWSIRVARRRLVLASRGKTLNLPRSVYAVYVRYLSLKIDLFLKCLA